MRARISNFGDPDEAIERGSSSRYTASAAPKTAAEGHLASMEALQQPSASLEALRQRKAAVETLLRQHQDLVARLDSVLEARKQNNKRMELPVDIGMGFTVEGIVSVPSSLLRRYLDERKADSACPASNDTGRVVVAAGPQDLYLELEVGHARDFVEKRCKLLESEPSDSFASINPRMDAHASIAERLETVERPLAQAEAEHERVRPS